MAQNGPTYNGVPNPKGDEPPNNGRRLLDNGLAPIINPVQAAEDEGNADGADALIDGAFSKPWPHRPACKQCSASFYKRLSFPGQFTSRTAHVIIVHYLV